MMVETIAPALYRTSQGDRIIPLILAVILALAIPLLAWLSGVFFWLWGLLLASVAAACCVAAVLRWNGSRNLVRWNNGSIELVRGGRTRLIACSELTAVEVKPSSVRTILRTKSGQFRISHRLAGFEDLLAKVRTLRPDLFPAPAELIFRTALTPSLLQLGLASGTSVAALLLATWHPWLGAAFGVSSASVLLRILLFLPRSLQVEHGGLNARYWLRRKRWGRPISVREEEYAADGVILFRLRLDYGRRKVFLDEGQLLDPLRPHAARIAELLSQEG